MRIGVVFPQTEIGTDPAVIRDFAQTAEGIGYKQILAYEHVLGAGLAHRPDWQGAYSEKEQWHEIFVLFGYLAAFTRSIELVTGVLVLPMRQTALVAKQAASVDLLSRGRLRLGVGVGWNQVEFEAMGPNFHNRGKRIEEQIALLRRLWTEPVVDFKGEWDQIPEAGLNPLPLQQPIPIWIGGTADAVLERTVRIADGWFPNIAFGPRATEVTEKLREHAAKAGRDMHTLGIEARGTTHGGTEKSRERIEGWRDLGATHYDILTMGMGLTGKEHVTAIESAWKDLGLAELGD